MIKTKFLCRKCKKLTDQFRVVVTDLLPPNTHVLQCTICSNMGIALVDDKDFE
jgi:hypothetical protein